LITYVDSSVVMKLLVSDEDGGEAVERLWMASDVLMCSEIGWVEVRSALAAATRARRLSARAHRRAKSSLAELWGQLDCVPVSAAVVAAAGDIAEAEGLRSYDAVHLAAALASDATVFAAADRRLLEAAHRRGFDTADPTRPPEA